MHHSGFTLIELLVVLAIISVLAAIAIPQYGRYRARAFDVRALTDLHNGATAEEEYFLENENYLTCRDRECLELQGLSALSAGVALQFTAHDDSFTGESSHPHGSGRQFVWDSAAGGLQNP